ncbi:prolyl oligopeptidase family protein [Ferruginibacter yonginensis]|uniref:prolyl oligopeptidase n=1 Tax=Ferruginibacter yonginensis TaxID=1310416 RepID=A0ABV8QT84_9BACT
MKHIISLMAVTTIMMQNASAQLVYPVTPKTNQTDVYFNTKVDDPYRWLEDDKSEATKNWVIAQNEVTFGYLNKIPYRQTFKAALEKVFNYPKYSAPFKKGDYYYFYKNNGLQNQSVLYRQKGLKGAVEMVIDPNTLSKDGTTRLTAFSLNKKGTYAVMGLSEGGSDWQTYKVRDMQTGKDLADQLNWVKISGIAWKGDGFYYSRYPAPANGASALSVKNENHQVWFHKVGTAQSADVLVYEDAANPQRFHTASTSSDEQYLYLTVSDRGKGFDGNALFVMDLNTPTASFKPIVKEVSNFSYNVVHHTATHFIIQTNANAPNKKVIAVAINNLDITKATTLIPEQAATLLRASTGGGKIFADYLEDVATKTYVYNYEGKKLGNITYPALGNGGGLGGDEKDKTLFYVFSSFTIPPTIYQYDIATGKSTVFRKPEVAFNPAAYETKQVFYTSKDGTKIPMYIISKKGIKKDGNNVTLLYGYGGFNINLEPGFSATLLPFLDAGGVYAQANLRGGGEYGEKWHKAGMLLNKQNVFDDFIAAGEYLIKEKYTSNSKLALRGGSNGGLLVGAVINQRPDLARVAIPQVGVMDMLRFHKFTIGWNWIADYGSSEQDEANFKNLYAYSPLHNISNTKAYPSTLVTTADHDDRVVPAHSFKYIATLQEMYKGNNPVLIRIDTNSGHGASNTQKNIETLADIYSFIFSEMGVKPTL